MTPTRLPLTISEAAFQSAVLDLALLLGWHVSHQRPSQVRPGKWATTIQGHVGAPDLLLARDGVVLCVELKSTSGRLTPSQREWASALGGYHRCWRPGDWPEVLRTLRDGPETNGTGKR